MIGKIKMIGESKSLIILTCVVTALFLVFTACDQTSPKSGDSSARQSLTDSSSKSNIKHLESKINLVQNPSFEEGKIFNSGLYEKDKSPLGRPSGWTTHNQLLNDSTGWSTEAHTGKRSLEIKNIGGTDDDAYWKGEPIVFKKATNAFEASIWTKTKDIVDKTGKGRFQLVFDVTLEAKGKRQKPNVKRISINIPSTNHDWTKIYGKTYFEESIVKVIPYLYFSDMIGTVWFDNLSITGHSLKSKVVADFKGEFQGKYEMHDGIIKTRGTSGLLSKNFIKIDPNEIYELSGLFKSNSKVESRIYFGFEPFDKDKKLIFSQTVLFEKGSETELVKACKSTDKVLYVKDASNWISNPHGFVAFGIKDDKSDLPNNNLCSMGIEKILENKIYLKNECGKEYPVGAKIREHKAGGSYIYSNAANSLVPNDWKEYSSIITPISSLIASDYKFYPGTKYVKIVILANLGGVNKNGVLLIKNITLNSADIK